MPDEVREHLTRDQRPFLHPESLQIFRFTASSLQFTSLIFYRVQIREHLTRDQRSFLHPESLQILQIHSFSSSVHLTHLLQGSDQRTPDPRSETIPSSRITPDPPDSQLLLFSSPHSVSTGFRSENTWHEIRDHSFIQNHSRSSDSQLLLFSSLTHLLQGSGQRTPDTRSETIPSSRITPDLQIHSFFSSVHLTHLLQDSGQRTPDTRSETIPSSRITPDPPDSQLLLFSSPHSVSTGFRSENTWHEIRDHSFIQNHSRSFRFTASSLQFTSLSFYRVQVRGLDWPEQKLGFVSHFCVVFEVCVWIIVRLEDPNMAHYKISNRVSHLLIFYLLVFDRIHDAMRLNKMSRTSSRNIDAQHENTAVYLIVHMGYFLSLCSRNPSWVFAAKK